MSKDHPPKNGNSEEELRGAERELEEMLGKVDSFDDLIKLEEGNENLKSIAAILESISQSTNEEEIRKDASQAGMLLEGIPLYLRKKARELIKKQEEEAVLNTPESIKARQIVESLAASTVPENLPADPEAKDATTTAPLNPTEKTPETKTFSTDFIETIVTSLLESKEAKKKISKVVKSPEVRSNGNNELTFDTTIESSGFDIKVSAIIANSGNNVAVKSYDVDAKWPAKGRAEKALSEHLDKLSGELKKFIEREEGKKVEKIEIVEGELKVTFVTRQESMPNVATETVAVQPEVTEDVDTGPAVQNPEVVSPQATEEGKQEIPLPKTEAQFDTKKAMEEINAEIAQIERDVRGEPFKAEDKKALVLKMFLDKKEQFQAQLIEEKPWIKRAFLKTKQGWENLEKTPGGRKIKIAISAGLIGLTTLGAGALFGTAPISAGVIGTKLAWRISTAEGINMLLTSDAVGKVANLKTTKKVVGKLKEIKSKITKSKNEETEKPKKDWQKAINIPNGLALLAGGVAPFIFVGGLPVAAIAVGGTVIRIASNYYLNKKIEEREKIVKKLEEERIETIENKSGFNIEKLAENLDLIEKQYDIANKNLKNSKWGRGLLNGAISMGVAFGTTAALHQNIAEGAETVKTGELQKQGITETTDEHGQKAWIQQVREDKGGGFKKVFPDGKIEFYDKDGKLTESHQITNPESIKSWEKAGFKFDKSVTEAEPDTQPKVETVPQISATVRPGGGGISLVKDLQNKLNEQYPDIDKAPQSVKDFLAENPTKTAINLGLYKPNEVAESALIHEGSILELNANGNISLHDPLTNETNVLIDNGEATASREYFGNQYTGKMLDSDHSAQNKLSETISNSNTKPENQNLEWEELKEQDRVNKIREDLLGRMSQTENTNTSTEETTTDEENFRAGRETTEMQSPQDNNSAHREPYDPNAPWRNQHSDVLQKNSQQLELSGNEVIRALHNDPDFIRNPYNLEKQELLQIYDKHHDDISRIFRHNDDGLDAWDRMKELKAGKQLEIKNYNPDNRLLNYLHELRDISKSEPKSGFLGLRKETVGEYTARALQKIAKEGNLGQLTTLE